MKKSTKEAVIILMLSIVLVAAVCGLIWAYIYDLNQKYDEGYIAGQRSINVKYTFHGTVMWLDTKHRSYTNIGQIYDCKLYKNSYKYGCNWLTDTLKIELLTK